ncbi:Gfo/Idh/MocA family protein [Leifsonia poae]|uniref:Gfo/Idh/MocA family protein n=1 Tax=Leifsonia poae TaxID=110933 RepID=UPI001CBF2EA8|nr:Gfo/Idh/MocA family oxidoreductase [Leifsonia poae]
MNTLRVGLIGAGGISHVHAAAWRELGARVSVHSHVGAEALAEQYGFTLAPSLDELLAAVDIVDIVTPSNTHRDLALAAIAAGKHVVCEKPLATTAEAAREIVAAAQAAGVQVYPAHVVRFFPDYSKVEEQVTAGRIGTPAVLRFVRGGEAPRSGSWFFDESAGGGIVLDQMIHDLDQALWLAGPVTEVYAVQSPASVNGRVPEVVTAHVVLTHAGGAISHVQGTWGARGTVFRTSADIAGTAGVLAIDSGIDTPTLLEVPENGDAHGYLPPAAHAESPYTTQLREIAEAFAGGPVPRVTPADGIRAVALAEAAAESLRTGRVVGVDLAAAVAGPEVKASVEA